MYRPAWTTTAILGRVAGDARNVSPDDVVGWLTGRVGKPVRRRNERQPGIHLLWGNTPGPEFALEAGPVLTRVSIVLPLRSAQHLENNISLTNEQLAKP